MTYDPEADAYICSQGKLLHKTGVRSIRTSTGYISEKTVYECADCAGCPCKEKCIRSKSKAPLEERSKRLEVSRYFPLSARQWNRRFPLRKERRFA